MLLLVRHLMDGAMPSKALITLDNLGKMATPVIMFRPIQLPVEILGNATPRGHLYPTN